MRGSLIRLRVRNTDGLVRPEERLALRDLCGSQRINFDLRKRKLIPHNVQLSDRLYQGIEGLITLLLKDRDLILGLIHLRPPTRRSRTRYRRSHRAVSPMIPTYSNRAIPRAA